MKNRLFDCSEGQLELDKLMRKYHNLVVRNDYENALPIAGEIKHVSALLYEWTKQRAAGD